MEATKQNAASADLKENSYISEEDCSLRFIPYYSDSDEEENLLVSEQYQQQIEELEELLGHHTNDGMLLDGEFLRTKTGSDATRIVAARNSLDSEFIPCDYVMTSMSFRDRMEEALLAWDEHEKVPASSSAATLLAATHGSHVEACELEEACLVGDHEVSKLVCLESSSPAQLGMGDGGASKELVGPQAGTKNPVTEDVVLSHGRGFHDNAIDEFADTSVAFAAVNEADADNIASITGGLQANCDSSPACCGAAVSNKEEKKQYIMLKAPTPAIKTNGEFKFAAKYSKRKQLIPSVKQPVTQLIDVMSTDKLLMKHEAGEKEAGGEKKKVENAEATRDDVEEFIGDNLLVLPSVEQPPAQLIRVPSIEQQPRKQAWAEASINVNWAVWAPIMHDDGYRWRLEYYKTTPIEVFPDVDVDGEDSVVKEKKPKNKNRFRKFLKSMKPSSGLMKRAKPEKFINKFIRPAFPLLFDWNV